MTRLTCRTLCQTGGGGGGGRARVSVLHCTSTGFETSETGKENNIFSPSSMEVVGGERVWLLVAAINFK